MGAGRAEAVALGVSGGRALSAVPCLGSFAKLVSGGVGFGERLPIGNIAQVELRGLVPFGGASAQPREGGVGLAPQRILLGGFE